jgi:hypothetical protein
MPFLKYKGKWAVILALTSNKSAEDFENFKSLRGACRRNIRDRKKARERLFV